MRKCIVPGTFDPIQDGHLNIIKRASNIFDEVVVAVAESREKQPKYSLDNRVSIAKEKCSEFSNVEVKPFSCLLVDFVKKENAECVVKGLRNVKDFEYESNMSAVNNQLDKDFETIFLISDPKLREISSSQIRELESLGIDPGSLTKN